MEVLLLRERKVNKMDFSVREILEHVSTGQNIRLILLYDDGDESGSFIEFENDKLDLKLPKVKHYLDSKVIWLSSEPDDYLRLEVYY